MAALDKLVKALEGLKIMKDSTISDESVRRKEKAILCVTVADLMCSPAARNAPKLPSYLSYSMETLLHMCDDPDSNIRMAADESLNRIIRAMMESNIVKVLVELHKEIKANGKARSLRAALWRFGELAHMIRPQKGKPFIQNLVPCIIQIAKRTEELVLETLATAMPKIFLALGTFTTDNDIKSLLRTFLANLSSDNTVVRRTAASSILAVCLHCRKPQIFLSYTLNTVVESILPVKDDQSIPELLGVLNLTRQLLPHFCNSSKEDANSLNSSLGVPATSPDSSPPIDRFIQVYELCLHWSQHQDQNVVTGSLETLLQLLSCNLPQLTSVLTAPAGLSRTRILPSDNSNKLSSRTLSQMSVVTSSVQADESALLDPMEDCPQFKGGQVEQWVQSTVTSMFPNRASDSTQDETDQEYMSEVESEPSSMRPVVSDSLQRAPSLESEQLIGRDDSPSPPPTANAGVKQVWDIGTVIDTGPALVHCARHLFVKFLLPEEAGIRVRVSVRALALNCLSQVLRIMPRVFLMHIDRRRQTTSNGVSHVSDVLSFATHADQQIRGLTGSLIGYLVKAALCEGRASYADWSNSNHPSDLPLGTVLSNASSEKHIPLATLISLMVQCLEDESYVCVRHTLTGVSTCLDALLGSKDSQSCIPILHALTALSNNPYWLIKVKAVELLSSLNYLTIHYVIGNSSFQDKLFNMVLITQLGDQDSRVRKATAEAITKVVDNLFYPIDYSPEDLVTTLGIFLRQQILSGLFDQESQEFPKPNAKCETVLSRIVSMLSHLLLQSTSKFLTAGCCETLGMLSLKYPCNEYPRGWQCKLGRVSSNAKSTVSASSGLLATVLAYLTSSSVSLDLEVHSWLLLLAGNLLAGLAESGLQTVDTKADYDRTQLWAALHDKKLAVLSEQLVSHVMRMLSVFVMVLEEVPAAHAHSQRVGIAPSPVKRRPSRASSPAKLPPSAATNTDKESVNIIAGSNKEEKGKSFGHFSHLRHYCKLHENLIAAYSNYKISLEGGASEKFVNLLRVVLKTLGHILEYSGVAESGRIAEELLHSLCVTVALEPTCSIKTVQQLLKSLFGANYLARWDEEREKGEKRQVLSNLQDSYSGFYYSVFQQPYTKLGDYLEINSKTCTETPRTGPSYVRERIANSKNNTGRNSDKASLASYIRLFEPMVIQALKKYTVTSCVSIQIAVLDLLSQLVQLRVNYCLLDSDQIFITFIHKQFDFLEEGQIRRAEELIPKLFQFLIYLSHEKNHSKSVTSFSRVIQLCAGLMASGQNPVTHCIPALLPVVEHAFLSSNPPGDVKELETQREFLITMLLRLVEYPQVLHLLSLILGEGWRWEERWRKLSRHTADTILPKLAQGKVILEKPQHLASLLQLLNSLAPGTLRPVDQVLKVLFTAQQPEDGCSTERWLSVVVAMCVALGCQGREDTVLSRLEELQLCVHQQGDDPLNVIAAQHNHPPQLIFAKLLLHVIESVVSKLETASKQCEDAAHIENIFAHFLLICLHMFQSGSYVQVATALIQLVREPEGGERLKAVNSSFTAIASCCPLITLLWSYLLTLINYGHTSYWSVLMQTRDRDKIGAKYRSQGIEPDTCHNLEVVRRGAIILYSDYVTENVADSECLTWLIVGHVEELINLSTEPPVQELLAAVHRNPAASGLMVQAVATRCTHVSQVKFLCKLLTCLETVHERDSGAVLKLLVPILLKHPHLVVTKRSTTLASRKVEILLTLERSEVVAQIDKEELQELIESLSSSMKLAIKHSGLLSLLNKLSSQCFDLSPVELDQGRPINATNIRMITLDRAWFLTQVKLRCCGKGKNGTQCAQLLSNLDEEDIIGVLRSEDFDNAILQHCFTLGIRLTQQAREAKDDKKDSDVVSPLFKAARRALLHHIHHLHSLLPRVHQAYSPVGRPATVKECKYKERIDELFCDTEFIEAFFKLVPAVGSYMQASSQQLFTENGQTSSLQPKESDDDIIKFAVLCLESIIWLSSTKMSQWGKWPSCIQSALQCSVNILKQDRLVGLLSFSHISSIVSSVAHLLDRHTDKAINIPTIPGDIDPNFNIHTSYQMAGLISVLEKSPPNTWNLPQFMSVNIKKLIVSVGRSPLVNWHSRTPQEGWGPPDPGAAPPILSPHLLQDVEVMSLLVFRLSLLGWTNRQQFEETWMTLLSVVTANSSNDSENEQSSSSIQGNSLTVKALSTLLLQTTVTPDPGNPGTGKLLHCPRDEHVDLSNQSWGAKYEAATDALYWKLNELEENASSQVYLPRLNERVNVERINSTDRYGYGQVSVKYLKTNVMSSDERATVPAESQLCKMCLEQQQRLAKLSIDLQSCLQFLLDLYSQWMHPDCGVSLNVLLEIVRSTICLSDLFLERSHFSWMLDMCLELSKSHPVEDEIMHQYLLLAVCKAASVLPTLETDVIERILKLLENALKASFLPARHSALHGLLYLLQSHHILETEEPVEQKPPVVDTRQRLLQASLDFINRNLTSDVTSESSEESSLTLYALVFYTLEHAPETLVKEIPPTLIQLTQNAASSKSINLYQALIQGLDRLVLLGKPDGIREQTTRLATELLAQSNPAIFLPALQLLLSCTYSGEYDKAREREDDAEVFVAAIEKTSTLFNRIKRAYPVEAECVCTVLPFLLGDFFPAAKILSKVIGEFLAPTQPHPRLLAPVVFKVFDQACSEDQLPLLQAWVVMSLGNFTQCLPMPMATWCLSCFFISASTNPWLRALYPSQGCYC
ncbi:huntingtin isoform X2 [Nilaparvata lugens]|uniref:huntingtin isoform X2 n=1 Tax=Nilaparvata lugens TaxID=108931 RepID=UPI00193CB751|nr:huntingtin isoform X2 [Nilaparvata lugens]